MFLVLEGLDGSGTTTQRARLAEHLRAAGHDVLLTQEPSDGPVGRIIRATLRRDPEAPPPRTLPWLFAADRADHLARVIEPALQAGRVVLSDRYAPSSLAYQSVERPLDEVAALNASFRVPDLTLFLRLPVDAALPRIRARGGPPEIFEERERLERVARQYDLVLARLDDEGWPIAVVDATPDPDTVTSALLTSLRRRLPSLGLPG